MSNGSLHFGIVVAGSGENSDPQGGGRVKVHVPNQNNPNKNSIDELPWVNSGHEPSGLGALGNARPPATGKTVLTYVLPGMSTTQAIPIAAINNQLSSELIAGAKELTTGLIKQAMEYVHPQRSGPPMFTQKFEDNSPRGSEIPKVTSEKTKETDDVPMKDKQEINSNEGANPGTVPKYKAPKSIGTALDEATSLMTSSLNSLLPGIPLNLTNMLDMLTSDMKKELQDHLPKEIYTAMENISKNSGVVDMLSSVSGFTQDTNNVNPATFATNALERLKTITNKVELFEALTDIQTSDKIKDLSSMKIPDISVDGVFGELKVSLSSAGTLTVSMSDVAKKIQETFSSLMSGIQTAGGEGKFQEASDIPGKLLSRLPTDIQSGVKEFLEKVGGTNNPVRTQVETAITALKGKIS